MSNPINIQLSEEEYYHLLFFFHFGHLAADHIVPKTNQEMLAEMEFHNKLCKQGHEQGSKHVFADKENGIYAISPEMEEDMLQLLEDFKAYIKSGKDDEFEQEIEKHLQVLENKFKKSKKPN